MNSPDQAPGTARSPAALTSPAIDPLQQGLSLFHATAPDYRRAAGWFLVAAQAGDHDGLAMFGLCQLEGLGLPANPVEARALLERAAAGGSAIGRFQFGRALLTGRGGPADEARGVSAYLSAAAMGHAEATLNLANCLYAGVGCLPDRLAAKALYLRSRALGCQLRVQGVRLRRRELKAVRTLAQRFADPNRLIFLFGERQRELSLLQGSTQPAALQARARASQAEAARRWRQAGRLAVGVVAAMAGTLKQYLRPASRDAGPTTLSF